MTQALIVADDLTGCLDSAVGFAQAGRRVMAARSVADVAGCLAAGAEVIGVNTASRQRDLGQALAALDALARVIDPRAVPLVMKKVDSRLKGHPAEEARALARLAGRGRIVAAPAVPQLGRLQRVGQLTGVGIDGAIDLAARLGTGMALPDVVLHSDLDALVASDVARRTTLWVGARDLAFALARADARTRSDGFRAASGKATGAAPCAVVVGSRDPITVAQVDHLAGAGVPIHRAPNGVVGPIQASGDVVVLAIAAAPEVCDPSLAGARFASGAMSFLRRFRPRRLLCSGGETANALLSRLGVGCLEILGEAAPGVPVCRIAAPWGDVDLITKSGGFGAPDLLSALALGDGLVENTGSNQDLFR
jgi:uncharacterized protein YgbK (DUF1537 family)